jgi:hypothetical protein
MRFRIVTGLALVVSMLAVTVSAAAQQYDYFPIATDEFYDVWERADRPVAEGLVARSWIWGPGGFTGLMTEPYVEADGGERDVQYFDKSRQEMPLSGDVDPDSPWFITQGLLATEMMTGRLQLGDEHFEQHFPAIIPVAGDPDDMTGPTYAAMGTLTGFEVEQSNADITAVVDRDGAVTDLPDLADFGIAPTHYDPVTNQNVASVFWDFMTTDDATVFENGAYVEGDLFLEPLYAVGRPRTEAYWAWVKVNDVEQWVLIQCFERRCLT